MAVIAVINQKGGVGKTTIAFHLVHAFANVLAIDTDPQANLTSRFTKTLPDSADITHLYERKECMPVHISDAVDLIGSDISLSFRESEARSEAAHYLSRAIQRQWTGYEYVIVDAPPNLGLFFSSALIAADIIILPIQTDDFSPAGLDGLIGRIQDVKDVLNLKVRIAGIIVNQARETTNYARLVIADVRARYGGAVFATVIPESVKVAEAIATKQPVWTTAPDSKAALAYQSFIQELKERIDGTAEDLS